MSRKISMILSFQIWLCFVQVHVVQSDCPKGEKFAQCSQVNGPTCKSKTASGDWRCSGGCVCSENWMVRNDEGVCIPVWECPNICPPNSKLRACVNNYRELCFIPESLLEKTKEPCQLGCSCIDDHVRVPDFSKCISRRSCRLNYIRDYMFRLG